AVVDVAAGQRAELGVVVLDDRRDDRRRPFLAQRAERVTALHDAPAVVAALLDAVDRFPEVLADLAGPQIAGGAVEAVLPRLPQAVRIHLRPRALHGDERVVLRDGVLPAAFLMIDVDAQDRAEQVAEVLPRLQAVGDAAAVAGAEVEEAV